MIKFLFVGRRANGTTRASALAHLRDVHGPMVVVPPADAGAMPADYIQNHVFDGAYPSSGDEHGLERDLVTAFWFESFEALQVSTTTPYYLANLAPDEPRFVDHANVAKLRAKATMLVAKTPPANFKMFLFLSRAFEIPDDDWARGLTAVAEGLCQGPGLRGLVQNDCMPVVPNEPPFAETIFEAWFTDQDSAAEAAAKLSELIEAMGTGIANPDRCLALAAEEYDSERLRVRHRQTEQGRSVQF